MVSNSMSAGRTNGPVLAFALPNAYFDSSGFPRLSRGRKLKLRASRTDLYAGWSDMGSGGRLPIFI